jgi:hypothetical protein
MWIFRVLYGVARSRRNSTGGGRPERVGVGSPWAGRTEREEGLVTKSDDLPNYSSQLGEGRFVRSPGIGHHP